MILSQKHVIQRVGLGLSALFSIMLLTACGGSGSTPSSTPTSAPTSTLTLKTFTGNGFSIGYPQDWTVKSSANPVVFTDTLGVDMLRVLDFYISVDGKALAMRLALSLASVKQGWP